MLYLHHQSDQAQHIVMLEMLHNKLLHKLHECMAQNDLMLGL
jgi:hypothetical protein